MKANQNENGYIVKDGQSEYAIVYSAKAELCEKFAACELQKYLWSVTGVSLPVVKENTASTLLKGIFVGATHAFYKEFGELDPKTLKTDGFVIKTKKEKLFIQGATACGTLYGVYDYLEKSCGVRFLDIHCEIVPQKEELPFLEWNEMEIPAFEYRGHLSDATMHLLGTHNATIEKMAEFYAKCRYTHEFLDKEIARLVNQKYGGTIDINRSIDSSHNNLLYVPIDKYYKTDEQKQKNAHMFEFDGDSVADICYSDGITEDGKIAQTEEMTAAKAYVEGVKECILNSPNANYYVLAQEDRHLKFCNRCVKLKAKYGSYTAIVIRFYNAVVREVRAWAKTQPLLKDKDLQFVYYAYKYSILPPAVYDEQTKGFKPILDCLKLPQGAVLRIADLGPNVYYSCIDNENAYAGYGEEYLQKWKACIGENGKSWYWGYTTNFNHWYSYIPTLEKQQKTLLALRGIGAQYAFLLGNYKEYHDFRTIMENYVASKLLWNPNQNIDVLRKEFIDGYYGVAAEEMWRYVRNFDETVSNIINNEYASLDGRFRMGEVFNVVNDYYFDPFKKPYFSLEFLKEQLTLLNNAKEKLSSLNEEEKNVLEKRLQVASLQPLYCLFRSREAYYQTEKEKQGAAETFFDTAKTLGVRYVAEHKTLEQLEEEYKQG